MKLTTGVIWVTFWKVAVLPCTGVLAPICSCWQSVTNFSISMITTDFSSSTSWKSEKETKTCKGINEGDRGRMGAGFQSYNDSLQENKVNV